MKDLKIYLDDDRPLHAHYDILIRSCSDFIHFVNAHKDEITHISLDHYLLGQLHTGFTMLMHLVSMFDDGELPKLKAVYSHSSDKSKKAEYNNFVQEVSPDFPFKLNNLSGL